MRWLRLGWARRLLQRAGYDVVAYPLGRYLRDARVDVVLDVGANTGQFGRELRRLGFRGRIVSFEPLPDAFAALEAAAAADGNWTALNVALGEDEGEAPIHRASNSASSSLRVPAPALAVVAPQLTFRPGEAVSVRRLDEVFERVVRPGERAFLKVDTQGFERDVVRGARGVAGRLVGAMLELSMVPLYDGEAVAEAVAAELRALGLVPVWFHPSFVDAATRRLVQTDAIFLRPPA